jgi:hypothetical protein
MAFRILNEDERKNFHKLFIQEQSQRSDEYDQNDENMQRRILFLQVALSAGASLGAILLWLAPHIR